MLRSFRLGNHRSFRDEHELLLMPAYDNERDVVPVAAVYGANASGKSNLLDGLRFMATSVRGWGPQEREPGSGIDRTPFRLNPNSLLEPSLFAVELALDSVRHVYGFTVDDERVREEWLYSYPHGRRRVLFEREGPHINFGSTVTQLGKSEILEELLTQESLFLSLVARLELKQYRPVFEWFRSSLLLPRLDSRIPPDVRAVRFIERSASDRATYVELAQAADIGITDIEVEYFTDPRTARQAEFLSFEAAELEAGQSLASGEQAEELGQRVARARARAAMFERQSRRPRLLLSHGPGGVAFQLSEESAGTQVWLRLLPDLITCLAEGKTMVIDEIDTSLHPLLVRKLVGLFRSPNTNPDHAQLIFTTHDAFLLAPIASEAGLDRDQVWFVEKGQDGASSLYPLTDFKPRNEHNLARRYLGGSYGAVPFLDDLDSLHIPAANVGEDT